MKDYSKKSNDWLVEKREILLDFLEKDKTERFKHDLHQLLEVERELTFREDR